MAALRSSCTSERRGKPWVGCAGQACSVLVDHTHKGDADVQAAQLSWHGKNDVLMWSVLLSVLSVAAVRHLLEASATEQASSLAATAVCWVCISGAALLTFQ